MVDDDDDGKISAEDSDVRDDADMVRRAVWASHEGLCSLTVEFIYDWRRSLSSTLDRCTRSASTPWTQGSLSLAEATTWA